MNEKELRDHMQIAEDEALQCLNAEPISRREFKRGQLQEDEQVGGVQVVTLRDMFALAYAAAGIDPVEAWELADEALAKRDE